MRRAPSQKDVRTVDTIFVAARSAPQHIHVLAMIGADLAGWPNDLLAIPVDVSDLGGVGASPASGFFGPDDSGVSDLADGSVGCLGSWEPAGVPVIRSDPLYPPASYSGAT